MDIDSLILPSPGNLVHWVAGSIMIIFMAICPGHVIQEEMDLIFKVPRVTVHIQLPETSKKSVIPPYINIKPCKREHTFFPIINDASNRFGVDPALVKAVIKAESNYNPIAISKRGAIGLMQLMPATADALGVIDLFNPEHNINGGVKYLKQLLNRFEGDPQLAVAAYNAGSKKVKKYQGVPPYKSTRYYVKKVFEYYKYYKIGVQKQKSSKI